MMVLKLVERKNQTSFRDLLIRVKITGENFVTIVVFPSISYINKRLFKASYGLEHICTTTILGRNLQKSLQILTPQALTLLKLSKITCKVQKSAVQMRAKKKFPEIFTKFPENLYGGICLCFSNIPVILKQLHLCFPGTLRLYS